MLTCKSCVGHQVSPQVRRQLAHKEHGRSVFATASLVRVVPPGQRERCQVLSLSSHVEHLCAGTPGHISLLRWRPEVGRQPIALRDTQCVPPLSG